MSETPSNERSAPPQSAATTATVDAARSRPGRTGSVSMGVLLAVIVAALGIVGWQWYDTRNQVAALQVELARRLTEGDARNKLALETAQAVSARAAELQAQVNALEGGLADSQNQQVALEALYQQLARGSDEWALADIEQTLNIAAQQLQLAGNVKAALTALQSVDARLQRLDRPQLAPLRKVIERDIERLQRSPFVDVVGITVKIDNLMEVLDSLPLAMQQRPPPQSLSKAVAEDNPLRHLLREMWQDLRSLIRIQTLERPEVPLVDPGQEFFLRENLRLRLLSARIALLQRDGKTYRDDLTEALQWVQRFYDVDNPHLAGAVATLKQLAQVDVAIDAPDIDASLTAVRDYRLTREKGAR
ncbi:MAG: uroporphyrinogen-III C-methyltransferase [Burkholderiales bacterium]|nr:uroporphyrinogen-III C-methyltransferase [Burkholderiales bacterium]